MNFEILENPKRVYEPNEIIEAFEPAVISTIGRSLTKISAKYSNDSVFATLSTTEKTNIYFHSVKYNSVKILAAVGIGTGVGTLVGAPVGALGGTFACPGVGTAAGAAIGGASGATIGAGIGVGYCVHKKYYYDDETVRFYVEPTLTYTQFQNSMTKDQHEILASFVNRYEFELHASTKNIMQAYQCPITNEIPVNPVFSPHDHGRNNPMEKEAIEKRLLRVASSLARARRSNATELEIGRIIQSTDPLGREPYQASDLIYDQNHVKKMLSWFYRIHADLLERQKKSCENSPINHGDNDTPLIEGLDRLICYYRKCHETSVSYTVNELCQDAINMGASFQKAKTIGDMLQMQHNSFLHSPGETNSGGDTVRLELNSRA